MTLTNRKIINGKGKDPQFTLQSKMKLSQNEKSFRIPHDTAKRNGGSLEALQKRKKKSIQVRRMK